MTDVLLGLLAVVVGAMFCFRGYLTMRIVIPIWGAFAGFGLGAGAVASITGDGFLSTIAGWLVGVVVAVVFSLLAYLYYEVSVVIAMGAIGFMLGSSVMVALNIDWTWVVVLVGVAVGVVLALAAIVVDVPMIVLTILTATAGASAVVGGLMLLFGSMDTTDLDERNVIDQIQDAPGWWVLYAVLAFMGVLSQMRALASVRGSLREQWVADGGHQLHGR